ncbi:BamA/TamA family outer membrane protein [Sphingobium sp. CR28]|uniref:BamA/TamA family outer membrane protein n=1 Tax=Sphingobium sp. CR28 TaxID=3400272 RepID=UPI003FEF439B
MGAATASIVVVSLTLAGTTARAQDGAKGAPRDTVAASQGSVPSPEADGPIIPDDEFDASIPPIDADGDRPMGSVQEWETEQDRRAAGGSTPAQSSPAQSNAARPETSPVAADALAAPSPRDPELDQPLAPLATFDVEPFDDSRYTEADDKGAAQTRYRYRLDGLDRLSDKSAVAPIDGAGIRSTFRGVSALEDGDGKAANGAMINARLQEDQKLLADILSGQGYFDSTVQGSLELPAAQSTDPITVVLVATPGPRYSLGAIRFDSPAVTPDDLIRRSFLPKSGEPIVAERILAAEANIAIELPRNGYPFVKIGDRDILLDAQTRTGDYTLPVAPGPRSSFGDIVSRGDPPLFDAEHIGVIARFKKGELYDSRKVDDLRQALVATGLFSVVSVEPEPSGTSAGDGTDYAILNVTQENGPPRSIAGQAGYATGQGAKVDASWTHRNMFPPEGALIVQGTAGTQEQGLGVAFRRSNAGKRDRTVELSVDARHSNFDAYEAFTGRLAGRISRDSTPIWQKRITYSYGFELLGTNEQDYNFAAGELRRRTYYVAALPGQIQFDTSDSLLDPTRGFRIGGKLSPEASLGSGTQTYARAIIEGSGYYRVSDGIVLAGRARVGMIGGASRAEIAPSRRFYGGGGGSVRGFGYQELGPKDPEARPIGGRSLVEAAGEVRYRFGNYGIVGFVDAGQVYTSSLPGFNAWRLGVGIGGRFYTNFGPMRLDIATPIGRKPGESRVAVYVSIGQAF